MMIIYDDQIRSSRMIIIYDHEDRILRAGKLGSLSPVPRTVPRHSFPDRGPHIGRGTADRGACGALLRTVGILERWNRFGD